MSRAILASDSRRLHSLLRDQRLIAGIGRAWANEILWAAKLSPYQLSTQVDADETERLATAIHEELARGLELRLQGANDATTYRVHNKLGGPVRALRNPARTGRLRGAHDLLLPDLPDRRADAEGPPDVASAQVKRGGDSGEPGLPWAGIRRAESRPPDHALLALAGAPQALAAAPVL